MDEITAANKLTEELRVEMITTQEKIKKYSLQMEEREASIKQLKGRLLRSEEDHFKTLEEVKRWKLEYGGWKMYQNG